MRKKSPVSWFKYSFLGMAAGAVFSFSYFYFFAPIQTVAVGEKKNTVYPAQYSDTHITKNAIATDQRFSAVAEIKKESFLASVMSPFQAAVPAPEDEQPEKGTWLWTPTLNLTPAYWNPIIAGAKKNGIRTIYLSLDSYLDIYVMPDGSEKEQKKKDFDRILEQFISAAHKNNIAVDAEGGWRNWAEPWNSYKAFALLEHVQEFNASHAEKFRGFQYDIEPYLLDSYLQNKATVLRNFVDLVNETVAQMQGSDLRFSVVIPDFYDGASGETPRFFYGWRYTYAFNHLLNVLERRPGSSILVMAYRNFSKGPDGSIEISKDEIQTANDYHTKIVVAQETGDVPPPYITFAGTSPSYLTAQIRDIEKEFSHNKSYNGIALHYINSLLELKN